MVKFMWGVNIKKDYVIAFPMGQTTNQSFLSCFGAAFCVTCFKGWVPVLLHYVLQWIATQTMCQWVNVV